MLAGCFGAERGAEDKIVTLHSIVIRNSIPSSSDIPYNY